MYFKIVIAFLLLYQCNYRIFIDEHNSYIDYCKIYNDKCFIDSSGAQIIKIKFNDDYGSCSYKKYLSNTLLIEGYYKSNKKKKRDKISRMNPQTGNIETIKILYYAPLKDSIWKYYSEVDGNLLKAVKYKNGEIIN